MFTKNVDHNKKVGKAIFTVREPRKSKKFKL